MSAFICSPFKLLASDLGYPEGPVYMEDGSVILVEIKAEKLTKIHADGTKETIATIKGGPNGAAIGPDGNVFICNSGGFEWLPIPLEKQTLYIGMDTPPTYTGGSIDKVNISTGAVETLYTECDKGMRFNPATMQWQETQFKTTVPLRGPDDLVFDELGNFWFTDWGKSTPTSRDITGIYYATADGSSITQMAFPLNAPNGIALSPDNKRLYTIETYTGRLLYWELSAPGKISPNPATFDGFYQLYKFDNEAIFDSMAVDEDGNIYIATMLPKGNNPQTNGAISIVSPNGELLETIEIKRPDGLFAPLPSNICFGGKDRKTAYITLGASGAIVTAETQIPGLKLAY